MFLGVLNFNLYSLIAERHFQVKQFLVESKLHSGSSLSRAKLHALTHSICAEDEILSQRLGVFEFGFFLFNFVQFFFKIQVEDS